MADVLMSLPRPAGGLSTIQSHNNHELDVLGITEKTLSEQTTDSALLIGKFFLLHMLLALQYRGFGGDQLQKVAGRVAHNLIATRHTLSDDATSDESVDTIIRNLLDQDTLRRRGLSLNSNEPVVFIGISAQVSQSASQLTEVRDHLLHELRTRGIKPVRVYVAQADLAEPATVEVSLLNVVNTDVGGPSMIQLLDDAFHGDNWKHDLVSKEAWREYELLWRAEAWPQSKQTEVAVVEDASHKTESVAPTTSTPEAMEDKSTDNQLDTSPHGTQTSSDAKSPSPASEEESDDSDGLVVLPEHPEMVSLREREAARAQIQHPTWARSDTSSLLDIITSQSATLPQAELLSIIGQTEVVQPHASNVQADDGDEFELVESHS